MLTIFRMVALGACAWVLSAAAWGATAGEWSGPEIAGRLPEGIRESSGLAVSRRDATVFWTHGDGGDEPVLHAISADGSPRGSVRIAGVKNTDWEDIASFTLDGRAWLLVADVGDNRALRTDCVLYVIPEPAREELGVGAERSVEVAWRIPVTYPDGPRDCEAVAVDAVEGKVYLLEKRITPHALYVLPLRPAAEGAGVPMAERAGEMPAFPPAPPERRGLPVATGMYRPQPTGMDFAADGSAAVVVTYGDVLVYPKIGDESWADALARAPRLLTEHGLNQSESVAFAADVGEIVVTSEGEGAAILRYRRR